MKKVISISLSIMMMLAILLSTGILTPATVHAQTGEGWYLIDSWFYLMENDYTLVGEIKGSVLATTGNIYDKYTHGGEEGNMTFSHSRRHDDGAGIAGVSWQVIWDRPPSYMSAGQKSGFNIEVKTLSTSGSWRGPDVSNKFESASIETTSGATSSYLAFRNSEGNNYFSDYKGYIELEREIPKGYKIGDKKNIIMNLGSGYGYFYAYEWKEGAPAPTLAPTPAPAPTTPTTPEATSGAEAFESGARVMWQPYPGCLGYRMYRSKVQSQLGISVTDFYITSTSYADVNVEPNTTYYYTVKPVLAEANPFKDIEEKLGNTIATFVVTTGNQIYKPGLFKHFIMLKLDSPKLSVDGIEQEVDPGRNTAPIVLTGRTMVPIRAVVEAMDGTVGWDGETQKITLKARGNTVEMWMNKKDLKINGASKEMDVAPVAKNERTFVPVRFAAENLNCKVDWINSTKEAIIVYEE